MGMTCDRFWDNFASTQIFIVRSSRRSSLGVCHFNMWNIVRQFSNMRGMCKPYVLNLSSCLVKMHKHFKVSFVMNSSNYLISPDYRCHSERKLLSFYESQLWTKLRNPKSKLWWIYTLGYLFKIVVLTMNFMCQISGFWFLRVSFFVIF